MAKIETLVNDFKINYLREDEYNKALADGLINADEIYMTPEPEDKSVTQNASISDSNNYPIILASEAGDTKVTGTLNKANELTYNPNTGVLNTPVVVLQQTVSYGNTLPSNGTEGQIFLLLVQE